MPTLLSSFLLGDPFHTVNDPECPRAYAYGQYIICRRTSYFAVGGHQSVRNEIVEDHALGKVFKDQAYKIEVADGRTLYSVRMYTNLASLWQGWTKNLYSLIDSRIPNLAIILFLINSVALFPFVQFLLICQIVFSGHSDSLTPILLVLVAIQFLALAFWFEKTSQHHAGIDWRNFFLFPLGSLAVTVLYCHAAYLILSGSQVNWKGRKYVVNTAKTIQTSYSPFFEQPIETSRVTPIREVSTIR